MGQASPSPLGLPIKTCKIATQKSVGLERMWLNQAWSTVYNKKMFGSVWDGLSTPRALISYEQVQLGLKFYRTYFYLAQPDPKLSQAGSVLYLLRRTKPTK